MLLFILSALGLAGLILTLVDFALGARKIHFLHDISPMTKGPMVSIIVPARNEGAQIKAALATLLAQDYIAFEVVVVNDRSTDDTGKILDSMQQVNSQLNVLTVTTLPPNWLGKNHALETGAKAARGEILLFVDADVHLDSQALACAMRHFQQKRLDHLTIAPRILVPGWDLQLFMTGFAVFFAMFARPWAAMNPRSRSAIGIGAFNMIRRDAFCTIGGMAPISLRPDDDMQLGRQIKHHGLRQGFLNGVCLITVEWYTSLWELIHGLEKNSFSAFDYRVLPMLLGTGMLFVFFVLPLLVILVGKGQVPWTSSVALVLILAMGLGAAHQGRMPYWTAMAVPLAALTFILIIWRASMLTLYRGGIDWRGTFYSLKDLRRQTGRGH